MTTKSVQKMSVLTMTKTSETQANTWKHSSKRASGTPVVYTIAKINTVSESQQSFRFVLQKAGYCQSRQDGSIKSRTARYRHGPALSLQSNFAAQLCRVHAADAAQPAYQYRGLDSIVFTDDIPENNIRVCTPCCSIYCTT